MTKVLVVGADMEGERVLIERLHAMAQLPSGSLEACRDLDECDLLIVRDRPGLRNAAMRMRQTRPAMRLWVEDTAGRLRNGADEPSPLLDQAEIIAVLCGSQRHVTGLPVMAANDPIQQPAAAVPPPSAAAGTADVSHGNHDVVRALRRGLRANQGHALLCVDGQPLLALDFINAQAVALDPALPNGLAEAVTWLALRLDAVSISDLDAWRYEQHEHQGQRLPLRALLWQVAQQSGNWERVDARLRQGELIHLQGWPDFRVLARQQDVFRLCSLLVRRPSSLADCVSLLDLAPATVQGFVHGAFLAGYVTLSPPPATASVLATPAAAAPTTRPGGGLLARMWRSVRAVGRGN